MAEILAIIPISVIDEGEKDMFPTIGGKLLPLYTFDAVKSSRLLTRTVVATDNAGLADFVRGAGIETPFIRPAYLSARPIEDVLLFTVEWLQRAENYQPDWIVHLQITHPFRRPQMIDDAITTVLSQGLDSAFAAFEEYHSYWYISESGQPEVLISYHQFKNQGKNPVYRELRGLFSMVKTSVIQRGTMYGERLGIIPVRELGALVDTRDEFGLKLAELIGPLEQILR